MGWNTGRSEDRMVVKYVVEEKVELNDGIAEVKNIQTSMRDVKKRNIVVVCFSQRTRIFSEMVDRKKKVNDKS